MANDFDEFERDLLQAASEFHNGKYAKAFLRKQSRKLNKEQRKKASQLTKRQESRPDRKTGMLLKSFKTGKVYIYRSDQMCIRAYSNAPHAHLLNDGHIILARGKNLKKSRTGRVIESERRGQGAEVGFALGVKFMEKAEQFFEDKNFEDTQQFIDDMLNKHGL